MAQICVTTLSGCKLFDLTEDISAYPTTIYALSSSAHNKALDRYTAQNEQICGTLDKYGFCEDDKTLCAVIRTEISDETKMISMARAFMSKNVAFTGITGDNEPKIEVSLGMDGCIKCDGSPNDIRLIKWSLRFDNQHYGGLEVLDTRLYVYLNDQGVFRFGGHWYPEITIPSSDVYNLEEAKITLLGETIHIECFFPWDIIVSADNIRKEGRKVVVPVEKNNRIELRVAWEIHVADVYVFYVDVMTGEIVLHEQTVIC